ncbi:MAG TPA: ATP-binding protein [Micromonosporaceae bacterium]
MANPESGPAERDLADAIALDQSFDVDGLYSLRSALVAHGSELGATETDLERLVLVASELATNAVRHGGGSGRLRMWRSGDQLICEVTDGGAGLSDPDVGVEPVEPNAMGGRGLWICRTLSDTFALSANGPGARVTVGFNL